MGLKLNNRKNTMNFDQNPNMQNPNLQNPNMQMGNMNNQQNFSNSGNMNFNSNGGKNKQPKVKKEKLRNVSNNAKKKNIIIMLVVLIVIVLGVNIFVNKQAGDMVKVVVVNSAIPQDGIIKSNNLGYVSITNKDFNTLGVKEIGGTKRGVMIKYNDENLKKLNNTYAAYYLREGTPIYWDAIGSETPKQYSYLYNMDGELLKVSMDANTFGQMIVPGDHINVRAAYSEPVYRLPTKEEFELQQATGIAPQNSINRQILLFNNVAILDMLNANGESIFDKYYELLALPKNEQVEMVQSEEFIASVQPSEILLNVTPEEADNYMSIQSMSPRYMMTMLPRTSSNAITEVLNELAVGFARDNK